jgi:hypothetical protein
MNEFMSSVKEMGFVMLLVIYKSSLKKSDSPMDAIFVLLHPFFRCAL